MITTLLAVSMLAQDGIDLKFVPSGAVAKAGGYAPIRAAMSTDASGVKKAPASLKAPKYGEIKAGPAAVGFILDEGVTPAKIYIDANDNGDYTDDPAVTYTPNKQGNFTMHQGSAVVNLGMPEPVRINFYRFDPSDPSRAQLKDTLLYYYDFGHEATLRLGGKEYKTVFVGEPTANTSFWVDRNGDGQRSFNYEMIRVGQPFNFTGTTYVLDVTGGKLALNKHSEALPVAKMAPTLTVGNKALAFTATATDGTKIDFPSHFKGKIVMMDFWATWCGPCIAELPNLKKAYNQFHDQGFEVLGISFDQANMAEKLADFTKKNDMPWPQIYEGKYWETTLGKQYDVSGIPFCLLVDGDTGEILATSRDLRGEKIMSTIENALAKKKGIR